MIKHDKVQIFNYLHELCEIFYESEYDLHHEFSTTITERDEMLVKHIFSYIVQRKLFHFRRNQGIKKHSYRETFYRERDRFSIPIFIYWIKLLGILLV